MKNDRKPKQRYTGKKSHGKGTQRVKNTEPTNCGIKSDLGIPDRNDPSWYNNDSLLDKAAKVSFCNALGDRFSLSNGYYSRFTNARMPGICVLDAYSGVGYSKDNTSALNIAAQEMYTKVRNVQSSAARYGKQDLMMYYITVQQALNLYWAGARALGVTNYINRLNRYIPWQFSEALGFDLQDIAANANKFANVLNLYAKQIAAYAIPNNFNFADRQKFMFSHIFAEGQDLKSKYYLVRPAGYFKFKLDESSKGMLEWNTFNYSKDTLFTVDTYKSLLDEVVASFVGDEDFGTMSGDIMKAFPSHLVGWEPIDINYSIVPRVDYDMLTAIHNATILSKPLDASGNIIQDPGINKDYIICNPIFGATRSMVIAKTEPRLGNRILDLVDGYPTDANGVVEATRFMCIPVADDQQRLVFDAPTPVDIITNCTIYTLEDVDGTTQVQKYEFGYTMEAWGSSSGTWSTQYERIVSRVYTIALGSEFRFIPLRFLNITESDSSGNEVRSKTMLMNTIHNYAIVDKQLIDDLNAVCTMSLFSTKNL